MSEQKNSNMEAAPAAAELKKACGFDPLRYARRIISPTTGQPELKLDLSYKRLWFRLAHPNGKMLLNPLRITDQIAMFEAQIYLNRDDPGPVASFTSAALAGDAPGGRYIRTAQDEALSEALDNAGFGIQLSAFKEPEKDTGAAERPPQSAIQTHETMQASNPDTFNTVDEQQDVAFPVAEQAHSETAEILDGVPEKEATGQPNSTEDHAPAAETSHILQKLAGLDKRDSPTAKPVMEEEEKLSSAGAETKPDAENTGLEAKYPDSMSVEEIMEQITVEEAKTVEVDFGTCRGWLLGQVMQSRPASLRYLVYAPTRASNLLKAAATVLLNELSGKMAS